MLRTSGLSGGVYVLKNHSGELLCQNVFEIALVVLVVYCNRVDVKG